MKTAIVGGTSSLGRALKPVLSKFSEVITLGRKNCDILLDLTDPVEKIKLPQGLDVIIHTAAHYGGQTPEDILDAFNVNVLGTIKLCHAAAQANAKHLIFISSLSACLDETSTYYNAYAISKKHAEEAARYYCSLHDIPLTILRPSQVYGDTDSFKLHQPLIYLIIDQAERGEEITLYGSNDALRNYIHVDDLTEIIGKVVKGKILGTYSCLNPADVRYSQIAQAAIAAFRSQSHVRFLKDRPDIPDNIFKPDDSLLKKIGFYPRITIEEGMRKIAEYRKRHP